MSKPVPPNVSENTFADDFSQIGSDWYLLMLIIQMAMRKIARDS
jgi:hypothetical protein